MRTHARTLASSIVIAVLGVSACGESTGVGPDTAANQGSPGGGGRAGTPAPDFTTRDIEGKTVRLSDYLGKQVILLDFWSTFCEPCKAEFPHFNEFYQKHKARGFVVIAVSMDGPETIAEVPGFVQRYNLSFPVVLDEDSRIASLYNPKKAAPLSVLIDRQGRIAVIREGYNPGDEEIVAQDIAKVLDQPAPAK